MIIGMTGMSIGTEYEWKCTGRRYMVTEVRTMKNGGVKFIAKQSDGEGKDWEPWTLKEFDSYIASGEIIAWGNGKTDAPEEDKFL